MAFCKYCGNQIPDGGVCSCPDAQKEQGNAAQANPVNQPFAQNNQPANGGFNANEMIEKAKKDPKLLIAGAGVVIILILILAFVLGHTGAKGAAKKFAKASTKGKGKAFYSLTLPDDQIKELKDDDKWDDMLDEYKDDYKDLKDNDFKMKVKTVKKGKKLNKTALKGAEKMWEKMGADDPDAKKGYEYKIKVKVNDDGDKDTKTMKVCVVKFKGEGWKVIQADAEALKSAGDSDSGSDYSDYLDYLE